MSDPRERNNCLGYAAIFLATFVVYSPALRAGLIWNDIDYITKPELRSLAGLWLIWTKVGATEQYYPLLHSFFWLQHRLWADSALGYHIVNVALHATAACLLAAVVRRLLAPADRMVGWSDGRKNGGPEGRMIGRPVDQSADNPTIRSSDHQVNIAAWMSAALFALHPVMVESVAWISEQKNTLSTVFYLWAALVYLSGWSDGPMVGSPGSIRSSDYPTIRPSAYWLATALFLCALLSKSVTASLPAALLVALWWKRGRIGKREVVPLIPWFVAGAAVGLFTAWVEHKYIGANGTDFELSLLARSLLAGRAIWFYLGKLIWPANLVFIYPHWQVAAADLWQWVYLLAALGLGACLFALRRRSRAPLAAYLFFVGTLFPTIGFFNVYAFKFSYVADHWIYLPALGVFVLAAAGFARLMTGWSDGQMVGSPGDPIIRSSDHPTIRSSGLLAIAVILPLLGGKSWLQSRGYHDMETFYRTIISRNPDSYLAQYNLAEFLIGAGRYAEAEAPLLEAIRTRPSHADAYENLGGVLLKLKRPREAVGRFQQVFKLRSPDAGLYLNLGSALAASGEFESAVAQFREAVRLDPNLIDGYALLARALDALGRRQEAAEQRANAERIRNQHGPADGK